MQTVAWLVAIAAVSALTIAVILRAKRFSEHITTAVLFKAVALALSIGATILACEVALRLVPQIVPEQVRQVLRADPRNYGVAHPYIGHLQTPHHRFEVSSGSDFRVVYHTGAHGFPNGSAWPQRAEIIVVGDSLVFGYGVMPHEAWPAMLSRALAPAHVINLGLIGGGPQQYLRIYETFGVRLRPRLVIFGLFVGNDFSNAATFDSWLRSEMGGNYMVWRDFGRPQRLPFSLRQLPSNLENQARARLYPWLRRSHLFNLMRFVAADNTSATTQFRTFRFADGGSIRLHPSRFEEVAASTRPGTPEFELTLAAIVGAQRVSSDGAAQLLVVIQPFKEEVYLPLLGIAAPDFTAPLRQALEELGIHYLDTTPGFRERAADGKQLFFQVDGHPNVAGYSLIAELVASHLRDHAERYRLN